MTPPHSHKVPSTVPSTVKVPNFPKKIARNDHEKQNTSMDFANSVISNQSRGGLRTSSVRLRNNVKSVNLPSFNHNFTAKNSMANRKFIFEISDQSKRDFDPVNVYEGISNIDNEMEELGKQK